LYASGKVTTAISKSHSGKRKKIIRIGGKQRNVVRERDVFSPRGGGGNVV